MKVCKCLDWTILLLCVIGYLIEFCYPQCSCIAEYTLGIIGMIYCIHYIGIAIFCPIKRDWILAKGRFLITVLNFVSLIPFVFTLYYNEITDGNIYPQSLVFEDNLYTSNNKFICQNDTICGNIQSYLKSTDTICDTLSHKSVKDSLFIYVENKLPKAISASQTNPSLFWTVYFHFIDPGNQHMTTSESGRKRAALIAICGFLLLNGLLISTLISWFDRRRDQWINGEIRYGWLAVACKKVAIVIGANDSTPTIIKQLLNGYGEKPVAYVILLTNEDVKKVRETISSYLNYDEGKRVIIYNGQLDSIEEIYKLHITHATEIYVLGENSNDDISQSYHDTQNMRCVHNIASYLTDKCIERKIICRVQFDYQTTYSVFQFSDLPNNIRQPLVFIPFNVYENWAQRVFVQGEYAETVKKVLPALRKIDLKPTWINNLSHSIVNYLQAIMKKNNEEQRYIKYCPLDGNGISSTSKDHVHLVVVGMSKMGIAMAIQAAQVAHYPNFSSGRKDEDGNVLREPSPIRTRITFIDNDAENEMNFFKGRYQHLFALSRSRYIDASDKGYNGNEPWEDALTQENCKYKKQGANFIDIEWEFVKGNVQSPAVMKYLRDSAEQANSSQEYKSLLTIAICHPLAHEAIAAALYMPSEIYDNALQILVYQREASDIVYNLSSKTGINTHKRYEKLRPFGMQYADFTMNKDNYYRSLLCNYVYTLMFDPSIDNRIIPDILSKMKISQGCEEHMKKARDSWKSLTIFNKWSNRYLSNSFETKLRSINASFTDVTMHYDLMCKLFEKNKMEMAECEHNRWNVQQLLMGFRAYKDDELEKYETLRNNSSSSDEAKAEFKGFKDKMKNSSEKVHLNICSISMLHELDKDAEGYDEVFNASIPAILKCIEKHNTDNKSINV